MNFRYSWFHRELLIPIRCMVTSNNII